MSTQRLRTVVRRYRLGIRILAALAMVIGVFSPSGLYFAGYAPPLFPPIGYAMSVASVVVIILIHSKSSSEFDPRKNLLKHFIVFLIVSILYVAFYSVLTISPPAGRSGPTMQTGLTLQSWAVTLETEGWLIESRQAGVDVDKQYALMARGAYAEGGLAGSMKVWKPWVVIVCGGWLVGLFITSFMLWAILMARIISLLKHLRLSELEDILSIFF